MEGGSKDMYLIEGGHERGTTGLYVLTSISNFTSVNTMVPEVVIPEEVNNSEREMWQGS